MMTFRQFIEAQSVPVQPAQGEQGTESDDPFWGGKDPFRPKDKKDPFWTGKDAFWGSLDSKDMFWSGKDIWRKKNAPATAVPLK